MEDDLAAAFDDEFGQDWRVDDDAIEEEEEQQQQGDTVAQDEKEEGEVCKGGT
jgi:hypothetical protein